MKLPQDSLKWLIAAVLLLLLIHLIPWGFILKIILIAAVVYFALNLKSDSGQEDADEPVQNHILASVRENGSSAPRTRRYILSSAFVDLTDSGCLPDNLNLQGLFSSVTVRLPVDASTTVHASGALCSISLPGRQSMVLGRSTHQCGTQDPRAPRIYIECACLFSSVRFQMG